MPKDSLVIAIDAMGGDHGPAVTVAGAALALQQRPDLCFQLHGDPMLINPVLSRHPALKARAVVVETDQFIAMDEKPAQAIRRRNTSLANAINAVKAGEAKAAVSAGNTGALMALSKMILKMITDDLERPAIGCLWPNAKGGHSTVLDVGANVTSDARQLIEFAMMGAAFHRAVKGVDKPSIGLLNIGSEDVKGHEEVREAHRLLRDNSFGLDYHGFVEGTDLCTGLVDVVVTDGFTGNVALKTAEGTARFIRTLLREALKSSPLAMLGALLAAPALKAMAKQVDPGASNGGPLLGLNGIVVKSHGGADAKAYANAIGVAASLAGSRYARDLESSLALLTRSLEIDETDGLAATGQDTNIEAKPAEMADAATGNKVN
ncbi:MAG: phosphate acyltransferase PlsX [Asticcacaulis sp.]|uniref:phosphate acyltransferase PlsX n=1 Tax=Asticcacaulis sp. TaxID=1872648 RepID=UPI003F7C7EF1